MAITIQATVDDSGDDVIEIIDSIANQKLYCPYLSHEVKDDNQTKFSIFREGSMVFSGHYSSLTIPAGIPAVQFAALVDLFNIPVWAGGGLATEVTQLANNTELITANAQLIDIENAILNSSGAALSAPNVSTSSALRAQEVTNVIGESFWTDKYSDTFSEKIVGVNSTSTASAFINTYVEAIGGYVARQSKQFVPVNLSGSLSCEFVVEIAATADDEFKAVGVGDIVAGNVRNGFVLVQNGSANEPCVSLYRNGNIEYSISKSSWYDPMDGTGISGKAIQWGAINGGYYKFRMDFEFFGSGCFKLWVEIDGKEYFVVQMDANGVSTQVISGGVLFVTNLFHCIYLHKGISNDPSYWKHILHNISYNGKEDRLIERLGSSVSVSTLFPIANTEYLLSAFQVAGSTHGLFYLDSLSVIATTNDDYIIRVRKNPTISSPPGYSEIAQTKIAIADGNGVDTVSGGTLLWSSIGMQNIVSRFEINKFLSLSYDLDGNYDVITISITPLTAALNAHSTVNIKSVR